jgi:TRAP-type C4-dicarboxylate transport system substrate-binding protein
MVLCLCLVGIGLSVAEAGEPYQLKIANAFVDSNPRAVAMKWMGEELTKRSNGRIKAEYYGNGVLGKEQELFQMTSTGLVHLYKGGGWEPLSGKFSLWQIPFAFQSYEEASAFNKSDYVKSIAKEASKSGIYIPAIGFTGARNIQTVSKIVREPEDLRGLKMRAPGQPLILGFYRTLGGNPISMAPTDVYMAFQTKVIDGACNDTANLWGYKLHEGAPNFTWIDYTLGADPTMISDSWYKSLPDDLRRLSIRWSSRERRGPTG